MTNKPTGINEDVFAVDMEQQQAVNQENIKKKRNEDTRFYRPRLLKKGDNYIGSYQTMIRPLPQKGWIQDKSLPFSQEQHMHYIKEKDTGLFLYIKCRKTLGPNEKCPICDANWAVWRKAKDSKDKSMEEIAKDRIAKKTAICNILICADLNNPDLNGEVKLWEHTLPINAKLLAPLRAGDTSNDAGEPEIKGFKKKETQEKVEFFIPFHPTQGRNRILIIEPPSDNHKIVSYNQSYWDEENSVLGWYPKNGDAQTDEMIVPATTDEIMAVLEKAMPLKEFIDDVPSVEEMILKLNEYNEKAISIGACPLLNDKSSGTRPALTPRPSEGNSKDFYSTNESTDVVETKVPPLNESIQEKSGNINKANVADDAPDVNDDENDDLPF